MTDDIVKCLRDRVNGSLFHWTTVEQMARDAADEIERLQNEVENQAREIDRLRNERR